VETWVLVKYSTFWLVLCLALTQNVSARDTKEIRFYKINKFEQSDRIRFTRKKARNPGCHNFLKKTRVFKAVQFGYDSCTLYSKKECAEGSAIDVTRKKESTPTTTLTQGYGWLTESDDKRGAKLRSWACQ
jgi:hypothetical protein